MSSVWGGEVNFFAYGKAALLTYSQGYMDFETFVELDY